MSFLGSWIVQRRELRSQWLVQDRMRRQDLYKEFIHEASECFAYALQHDSAEIASLAALAITRPFGVMMSRSLVPRGKSLVPSGPSPAAPSAPR